jgi:hypothetical protein
MTGSSLISSRSTRRLALCGLTAIALMAPPSASAGDPPATTPSTTPPPAHLERYPQSRGISHSELVQALGADSFDFGDAVVGAGVGVVGVSFAGATVAVGRRRLRAAHS